MAIKNQNFDAWIGDDRWLRATIWADYDAQSIYDLTNVQQITWIMRADESGAALITKLLSTAGIAITDGPNGLCAVKLVPADTAALSSGKYYHICKVTDAAGKLVTVFTGWVNLNP